MFNNTLRLRGSQTSPILPSLFGLEPHCTQRRQSGFKSGGLGSGSTNFDVSRQISEKFRYFQAIFKNSFDFPGKFPKNYDFFRQFKKIDFSIERQRLAI